MVAARAADAFFPRARCSQALFASCGHCCLGSTDRPTVRRSDRGCKHRFSRHSVCGLRKWEDRASNPPIVQTRCLNSIRPEERGLSHRAGARKKTLQTWTGKSFVALCPFASAYHSAAQTKGGGQRSKYPTSAGSGLSLTAGSHAFREGLPAASRPSGGSNAGRPVFASP